MGAYSCSWTGSPISATKRRLQHLLYGVESTPTEDLGFEPSNPFELRLSRSVLVPTNSSSKGGSGTRTLEAQKAPGSFQDCVFVQPVTHQQRRTKDSNLATVARPCFPSRSRTQAESSSNKERGRFELPGRLSTTTRFRGERTCQCANLSKLRHR